MRLFELAAPPITLLPALPKENNKVAGCCVPGEFPIMRFDARKCEAFGLGIQLKRDYSRMSMVMSAAYKEIGDGLFEI